MRELTTIELSLGGEPGLDRDQPLPEARGSDRVDDAADTLRVASLPSLVESLSE